MTLAVFNVEFQGLSYRSTTSENPAVAESVIGLDTLLTSAARALFGYLVDPEVDVRTGDGTGGYEVDFGFRENFGMARRAQLAGEPDYIQPSPETVIEALGLRRRDLADESEVERPEGWVDGLIPFLLKLDGRQIDRVFITSRTEVDVEVGDEMYHISYNTYRLLRHIGVRQGLAHVAGALSDPHITRVVFAERGSTEPIVELTAGCITALQPVAPKEVLLVDEVRTMALSLADPVYRCDTHWTFTDGMQTIRAVMCDAHFLKLIDNGVFAVKPGEVLIVNMHVQTYQSIEKGLESTYEILRVIDHRKPGKHILMPGI